MRRAFVFVAIATGAFACVDLFHSTDFTTLCEQDAGACSASDVALDVDVDVGSDASALDPFCELSPSEARAHAERACVFLGACAGATPESSFGRCMLRALSAYDCQLNPALRPRGATKDLWGCLANVASCRDVDRCLIGPTPPVCSAAGPACSTPLATTALDCDAADAAPRSLTSCILDGQGCVGAGVCTGSAGLACNGESRCAGSAAIRCSGAKDVGRDCDTIGAGRCIPGDGGASCAPNGGEPCNGTSVLSCAGSVAHACVDGHEIAIDCSAIGLGCSNDAGATPIDPIGACVDQTSGCLDDCSLDGGAIDSCVHGHHFIIDCASVGLGRCRFDTAATCRADG